MLNTRRKRAVLRLKRVGAILGIIYLIIGASLYFYQEKILFLPRPLPDDFSYEFSHPFEEVFMETDGGRINMIHFKIENPKGVVLYFNGNSRNLSSWGRRAQFLVDKQYDVLVMDYRTFGKSKGELSEAAFFSDAQFCYNYLLDRYDEKSISVYGRSLGTGIATYISSTNSPKQLVLETPYYSIADVGKSRFPIYPVKWLLKYKFQSYKYIQNVSCPITIFHGTNDDVVPYTSGKELYKVASKKNAEFITIDGGRHNNLRRYDIYQQKIGQIFR
ncbi:alpha/beta hydrolase [Seonamhaeicola maritimus]|uniref:alpha/beta hydrolase n=1 Tax=Seonamhaeicola maritimus TaxID=2591822 RepID=UPI0024941466|nr:alpha/beta hydrolase [Seonamhaeicola maritimus]